MNIVAVAPETRIDRLAFHSAALYNHVMHIGVYTCPHCRAQLEFKTTDFERHFASKRSNLEPEMGRAFDEFRPLNAQMWECFLDFNCFSCDAPVRFIYQPGEDRTKCYYYEVISILEVELWNHVLAAQTPSA